MRPLVDGVHHGIRRVASAPVQVAPLRGFRVTAPVRPLVDGVHHGVRRVASAPVGAAPLRGFRVTVLVRPLVEGYRISSAPGRRSAPLCTARRFRSRAGAPVGRQGYRIAPAPGRRSATVAIASGPSVDL